MALCRRERSLVKRLKGKPVVLLGVNSDPDREATLKFIKEQELTWPSWWDGPQHPIATKWRVKALPTVFILDAKGVVRYKGHGADIEKQIDALLAERRNSNNEK